MNKNQERVIEKLSNTIKAEKYIGFEQYKELMLTLYPREEFVDLDYVPKEELA